MMLFLLYMCNALRKALTGLLSPIKSYKHLSRDNSEPNRLRVPQHADISSKKKLFFKKKKNSNLFPFCSTQNFNLLLREYYDFFFPFLSEFPHVVPCNYFSRQKDTSFVPGGDTIGLIFQMFLVVASMPLLTHCQRHSRISLLNASRIASSFKWHLNSTKNLPPQSTEKNVCTYRCIADMFLSTTTTKKRTTQSQPVGFDRG